MGMKQPHITEAIVADIDLRILQLINGKSLNRIDENAVEISAPLAITPIKEPNGVTVNTQITITARPESRYKNSKTVKYRRNTIADEFAGYPDIDPTATRPVWKGMIYTEMVTLVEDVLSMFCIIPTDIDMSSFINLFPMNSRGRRELDLTKVINRKLTVVLKPTVDNYYYNGPVTMVFDLVDKPYILN